MKAVPCCMQNANGFECGCAEAKKELTALEDIESLRAELANMREAQKGKTFFHSDEAVNAEMGKLRAERDALALQLVQMREGVARAKAYADHALHGTNGIDCGDVHAALCELEARPGRGE